MVLEPEAPTHEERPRTYPVLRAPHLRDYLAIVLKNLRLVIAVLVVAFTLGLLKVWSQRPEFKATAQIMINPQVTAERLSPAYFSLSAWQKELNTYCHVLSGPTLAAKIVDKLGINSYAAAGFSEPEPGLLDRLRNAITKLVPTSRSAERSGEAKEGSKRFYRALVRKNIRTGLIPDANIIEVSYTCEDPQVADRICGALAQLFIEDQQERRWETARSILKVLQRYEKEFEKKLTESEKEVIDFLTNIDFPVGDPQSEEQQTTALNETIATLTGARAQAHVEYVKLEAALNSARMAGTEGNPLPVFYPVLENATIDSLRDRYYETKRQLGTMRTQYGPKHPSVRALTEELALIEEDIKREVQQAWEALRHRQERVREEEKRLDEEIERAKRRAAEVNKRMAEYRVLQRRAETNRQLFDVLLGDAKKVDLVSKMQTLNMHIITEPQVSRAPSHVLRTMMVAVVGGLAAAVGLALFLDYMDTSVATPADLESIVPADQLGVIFNAEYKRTNKRAPILPAVDAPDATITENFRNLRTAILYSPGFANNPFIVTTSCVAREGKTSVASNLAILIAQANKRVLLIDGDMRRPGIHSLFDIDRAPGLSDFLKGDAGLDGVLRKSFMENLSILTCGSKVSNPSELIGAAFERINELVERCREEFDLVIVDTPPMTLSDPYLLAKMCGGTVLLVVRSGSTNKEMVRRVIAKLHSVDAQVGGTVLNQFDIKKQGYYGYGYGYYDYYYYHYYYGYGEDKKNRRGRRRGGGSSEDET